MHNFLCVYLTDLTDRHGQAGSFDVIGGEEAGNSGAFRDHCLIAADALRQQSPADDRAAFQFGHVHDVCGNFTGGNKTSAGNMLRFQAVRDVQMPMDDHIACHERFIVVRRTGWDIDCLHAQKSFLFYAAFCSSLSRTGRTMAELLPATSKIAPSGLVSRIVTSSCFSNCVSASSMNLASKPKMMLLSMLIGTAAL